MTFSVMKNALIFLCTFHEKRAAKWTQNQCQNRTMTILGGPRAARDPLWMFSGRKKAEKGCQKVTRRSCPKRPGADPCAIWRRKRSNDAFSLIWGRFLSILEGFYTNLGLIFHDFLMIFNIFYITFCVLLNKSALTCFVICSKTQTLNPTNIQTTIKGKHFLLFIFQMSICWWWRESRFLLLPSFG